MYFRKIDSLYLLKQTFYIYQLTFTQSYRSNTFIGLHLDIMNRIGQD
jgi:hypothetical protein